MALIFRCPLRYRVSKIWKLTKRKRICNRIPSLEDFSKSHFKTWLPISISRVFFFASFSQKAKIRFRGGSHFLAERNDLGNFIFPEIRFLFQCVSIIEISPLHIFVSILQNCTENARSHPYTQIYLSVQRMPSLTISLYSYSHSCFLAYFRVYCA